MLTLVFGGQRANAQNDILALIEESNRSSIEAIQTLHAIFETVHSNQGKLGSTSTGQFITRVEWWQDGPRARWIEELDSPGPQIKGKAGNSTRTVIVRDGFISSAGDIKILQRVRGAGGKLGTGQGSIRQYDRDQVISNDVWAAALFVLLPKPRLTLAELIKDRKRVKSVKVEEVKGKKYYRIIVQAPPPVDSYQFEVLVDPAHNCLVLHSAPTSDSPQESLRFLKTAAHFQEAAPGIYFPTIVESKTYEVSPDKKTQLTRINTTSFRTFEVNKPINPAVFTLDFPPGTEVSDTRNQTRYLVGKDNKPIEPVVPPIDSTQSIVAHPSYVEVDGVFGKYTIIGVISVVAVMLGWYSWRFRRKTT